MKKKSVVSMNEKEISVMLRFASINQEMYLTKLFKLMYFFQLKMLLETGKEFFTSCNFIATSHGPVPDKALNFMKEKIKVKESPLTVSIGGWIVTAERSDWLAMSSVHRSKVSLKVVPEVVDLGQAAESVFNKLVLKFGKSTPSNMFEKSMFHRQLWREAIETGKEGKAIDLSQIFKNKKGKVVFAVPKKSNDHDKKKESADAENNN